MHSQKQKLFKRGVKTKRTGVRATSKIGRDYAELGRKVGLIKKCRE